MTNAETCEVCRTKDLARFERVRETEHNEYMGGKATETIDHFRCTECGAFWRRISERGAGGHGRFWTKLQELT